MYIQWSHYKDDTYKKHKGTVDTITWPDKAEKTKDAAWFRLLSYTFPELHFHDYYNMEKEDADYLAMLNNKTINPTPSKQQENKQQSISLAGESAQQFPELMAARDQISSRSKELSLVSETDAPFEWVSADWNSDTLPSVQQLVDLGWIDQSVTEKTKSIDEFFDKLTKSDDPYGQAGRFQSLYEAIQHAFEGQETKVYLLGDQSITVLILGIISSNDGKKALAGLRSLLVET